MSGSGRGPGRVRRPAASSSPEVERRLRAPALHGAEPRRVGVATITVVLVLAALVSLTMARPRIAERVSSPLAAKLADADRVAYYVVDPDEGPDFRIGPGDHTIKLITHLLLPADTRFDPEQEYAYGLIVLLKDLDGQELSRHELNIRTRQSKSGGDRFGWRYENAFMLDDDRQLSDDRLTRVRLPESDQDRLVELRLVPRVPADEVSALARVYARRPRPVDDRTLRELSLAPGAGRELVDHLTYRDWDQLSEDERRVKLSQVWERLAAEGEAGRDYHIISIYETGFRLPRDTETDDRRLEVERWRSLAINLLGPAELELRVYGDGSTAGSLQLYRVGLDGEVVALPRHDARVRPLTIPEGVHTLYIESERLAELELEVVDAPARDPVARVWLIEGDRPTREDEDGNEVLEPDRRRIQVTRVGAQWRERPRWAVVGPRDAASRTFRFDVRVAAHVASSWWREHGPTPTLDLCFLDAAGEPLRCDNWEGQPAIGSRFEGLQEGGEPQLDGEPTPTRWYVVSEPQTFRVVAPEEAASVELRDPEGGLDQRLIVRGYGYWPEVDTILGEPFRLYGSEQVRWRYPPLDARTWFPIRPSNYDELHDEQAIADLHAQVRLQPRALSPRDDGRGFGDPDLDDRLVSELLGEDGWDPGPWVTLEPRGVHRRRSILERLDADAARRLAERWDSSLFTELWPERALITDLGATGPGAPELHWRVDPRTLGRSVTLSVDGEIYTHELAATRGRWRLPVEGGGRRRLSVELDAPPSDYELWIDRPVLVGSPPVSRRRTIHELTTELVYPLVKPDGEALTVNVVIYLPRRRDRAELALSVDGGQPERLTGVVGERVSVADRTYTIDADGAYDDGDDLVDPRARVRFVDLDARQGLPLESVTVQITLGEDIVPGRHEVRLELLDGGRVWARAFHRGVADRRTPAASWTEAVDEGPAQTPAQIPAEEDN